MSLIMALANDPPLAGKHRDHGLTGDYFEHNFGYGKQHLSNLFATMILLAFLVHTTLDWIDDAYPAVRDALPSRRTFFEHLRALIQYLPFDNWDRLTQFMLERLRPLPPGTG